MEPSPATSTKDECVGAPSVVHVKSSLPLGGSVKAFAAFLKAVNVSGHSSIRMSELARVCGGLDFVNGRTLLASGNVTFQASATTTRALERSLEGALRRQLGLDTTVFVREADEWGKIVGGNPFGDLAVKDPGRLVVALLKEDSTSRRWNDLEASIPGNERVEGRRRCGYLYFPEGQGRSKLTTALMERHLRTKVTNRNWNTVLRVSDALGL